MKAAVLGLIFGAGVFLIFVAVDTPGSGSIPIGAVFAAGAIALAVFENKRSG